MKRFVLTSLAIVLGVGLGVGAVNLLAVGLAHAEHARLNPDRAYEPPLDVHLARTRYVCDPEERKLDLVVTTQSGDVWLKTLRDC
jgi:hypothetical protein